MSGFEDHAGLACSNESMSASDALIQGIQGAIASVHAASLYPCSGLGLAGLVIGIHQLQAIGNSHFLAVLACGKSNIACVHVPWLPRRRPLKATSLSS